MIVKLVLFAGAKEIVGHSELEIALAETATLSDLKQNLCETYPALQPLLEKSMFAVDQEYVTGDKALYNGVEVGFIPPVSGG